MKSRAFVILLACMVAVAATGCGKKEATDLVTPVTEEKVIYIETVLSQKETIENGNKYSGKIEPSDTVRVIGTVQGKVAKVNFDVGDKVSAGNVLFQMSTEDIQNSMQTLNASISVADANIASAQISIDTVNGAQMQSAIENAKSAIASSELAFNNQKTNYENSKQLYEQGVISKTEFDAAEMGFKSSEITYNQALENYNIVANVTPAENLQRAQAAYNVAVASKKSAQAQIASLEKQLRDSTVVSPVSGTIATRGVTAGTIMGQAEPAFTIINLDKVHVAINVSENIISSIQNGQTVNVEIAAVSDEPFQGVVKQVNPIANQGGTFTVDIEVINRGDLLKAGMFAQVNFITVRSENSIVLPRSAVMTDNEETYVFVEENGVAKKIIVTTGIDNGDKIEIVSGLEENLNVITKGQSYIEEGDKVQISTPIESTPLDETSADQEAPPEEDTSSVEKEE